MNVKTMLAANTMAIAFVILTGYCLYLNRTGFAIASLIIAASLSVTFVSKKEDK